MSVSLFDVVRLRNFDTFRAFLYVLAPVVLVATVHSHTNLWINLAAAVLAPALASVNSVDGFRAWGYRVLAAGQAVVLGLGVFTEVQISPWVAVIGAVVGGTVAAGNVRAQ